MSCTFDFFFTVHCDSPRLVSPRLALGRPQNKSKVNTSDPRVLVKKLQKELEDMKRALAEAKAGGGGGQGGGDGLGRWACGNQ
jgi:hypothetical protein